MVDNPLEEARSAAATGEAVLARQIAGLVISGITGPKNIATKLTEVTGNKYDWKRIRKVMASQACKDIIEDMTTTTLMEVRGRLRRGMGVLVEEAIRVVKAHLAKDNINAVPLVFKALGIEQLDDKGSGNTQIVIKLPDTGPKDVTGSGEDT